MGEELTCCSTSLGEEGNHGIANYLPTSGASEVCGQARQVDEEAESEVNADRDARLISNDENEKEGSNIVTKKTNRQEMDGCINLAPSNSATVVTLTDVCNLWQYGLWSFQTGGGGGGGGK